MRDILRKYKDRLINLSGRNRSLVMKKIYKKRAFDLSKTDEFKEKLTLDLLAYLFERRERKFSIMHDPYEEKMQEEDLLIRTLKAELAKRIKELKDSIKDPNELAHKSAKLTEMYAQKQEDELKKLKIKFQKRIDYSASLSYLKREIEATEKESGRYELFIGYPFVEGKFLDDTFVRAPLLLFPVKMHKQNNSWYIQNMLDQDILINKVFVFAYAKFNEVKISDFEMQFSSLDDCGEDIVGYIKDVLYKNKITIHGSCSYKPQKMIDYTNDNLQDYTRGQLMIKEYMILGQFPISNSIYSDYETLEKIDVDSNLLSGLLINLEESDGKDKRKDDGDADTKMFSEKDIYFLTPLDYSQEKAVKTSDETDQLVIYGPPGTGKSQTITNIIADNLAKGKKILMVSQKRAALDVIYNRLAELNSKVVLIHDANKDKKEFYNKAAAAMEKVNQQTEQKLYTIVQNAEEIDKKIERLEKTCSILHQPRDFGISLQNMYCKSKEINSKDDERFHKMLNFKNSIQFRGYRFQDLKAAVDKISSGTLVNQFIEYKTMLTIIPIVQYTKTNINNLDILEASETISYIIENICSPIQDIKADLYYKNLLNLLQTNGYSLDLKEIEDLADRLNHEQNKELLIPLNDGRWWSLSYWISYSKNKKQEVENKQKYDDKKQEILDHISSLYKVVSNSINKLQELAKIFNETGYKNILDSYFNDQSTSVVILTEAAKALDEYDTYQRLNYVIKHLNQLTREVLEYCYEQSIEKNEEQLLQMAVLVLEFSVLLNIAKIEKDLGEEASLLDNSDFINLVRTICNLMKQKNDLTPDLILTEWNNRYMSATGNRSEFHRRATQRRGLWPIRKYVGSFEQLVLNLFPCWLMGPETVSDILPLRKGMFDLIIFDEASQMFVENAIPTIYRGQRCIIAGDDKQLRPSSTFKARYSDIDSEDELDMESAAALEEESLLDLAKVTYNGVHLNYHYRSIYEELISFSNYAFYRAQLQVSPNTSINGEAPIERIKVAGKWLSRQNMVEAEKVVDLVAQLLKTRKNNETIGIITFNITQKDLIEDFLDRRAYSDNVFKSLYQAEVDRKEGDEDVSLFVKNIENVQGDERDIILFSIGYAPNENNRVSVNFGSLSQDGGENRLNVAISRAKKKIYVVTSIEPEELNVEGTKNEGPKLFKKYLQYVREVSNGNKKGAQDILNGLLDTTAASSNEIRHDSDFEAEVHRELTSLGYVIDTQVGVSGYKIDLTVYDTEQSKYVLGIECDGATYHSSKSARERDIHRQRYLESRGWKIVRIWSRDWWRNHKREIQKINNLLKTLITVSDNKENKKAKLEIVKHPQEKTTQTAEDEAKDNTINDKSSKVPQKDEQLRKPSYKTLGKPEVKKQDSAKSSNLIWFGDTVILKDLVFDGTFEVTLEPNPYNKDFMKPIELALLGRNLGDNITFEGFNYQILDLKKYNLIQNK